MYIVCVYVVYICNIMYVCIHAYYKCMYVCRGLDSTLDNKFQKKFCICDKYVINLLVCICEVRKGT